MIHAQKEKMTSEEIQGPYRILREVRRWQGEKTFINFGMTGWISDKQQGRSNEDLQSLSCLRSDGFKTDSGVFV